MPRLPLPGRSNAATEGAADVEHLDLTGGGMDLDLDMTDELESEWESASDTEVRLVLTTPFCRCYIHLCCLEEKML